LSNRGRTIFLSFLIAILFSIILLGQTIKMLFLLVGYSPVDKNLSSVYFIRKMENATGLYQFIPYMPGISLSLKTTKKRKNKHTFSAHVNRHLIGHADGINLNEI